MTTKAQAACDFHLNIGVSPLEVAGQSPGEEEFWDMAKCALGYARVLVYNLCMLYTGNDRSGTRQPTPFKVVQGRHIPWTYVPAGDCHRQYKLRDSLASLPYEGRVQTSKYDFLG